jgi:hypothetical protein
MFFYLASGWPGSEFHVFAFPSRWFDEESWQGQIQQNRGRDFRDGSGYHMSGTLVDDVSCAVSVAGAPLDTGFSVVLIDQPARDYLRLCL